MHLMKSVQPTLLLPSEFDIAVPSMLYHLKFVFFEGEARH